MSAIGPAPRPSILSIEPYVAGESKLPGVNRVIKLSSNEGAFGPPPAAVTAAREAVAELHRYPDGACTELRRAIGRTFGLDPARIVCGAGSDELIGLLAGTFGGPGTETLVTRHAFAMYAIYAKYHGSTVVTVDERNLTADVDLILAGVSPRTTIVFLANPNNPTGTMLPAHEVRRLRDRLPPHVLLVLDAAYAEYVEHPEYEAGAALVEDSDSTVMTRTFSKIFGLGGARLGWAYAPPSIIDLLNRVRSPFNVGLATQAAGIAALAEPGWIARNVAHNRAEKAAMLARLCALGLAAHETEGNFVLPDFGSAARADAADAHLKARGLIVRRMGGYAMPSRLRITVAAAEENALLLDAIAEFMATQRAHA
jgi:histidinol-phosphate aminotransferase